MTQCTYQPSICSKLNYQWNSNKLSSITQNSKYKTNLLKKHNTTKKPNLIKLVIFLSRITNLKQQGKVSKLMISFQPTNSNLGKQVTWLNIKQTEKQNPVEPIYKIPSSYKQADILKNNKFIRDTLNFLDIKGTYHKIKNPRNINQYALNEGSKPQQLKHKLSHLQSKSKENLDKKQISHLGFLQVGSTDNWTYRGIPPLESLQRHEQIEKSLVIQSGHNQDLIRHCQENSERILEDNSGMKTKRQTNPLQPGYQLFGKSVLYNLQMK